MNSLRFTKKRLSLFMLPFLFLCVNVSFPLTAARADDSNAPTGAFSTDILSQYIFRGVANSSTGCVIQPSFTATWNGFSANVWGNFDASRHSVNSYIPLQNGAEGNSKWSETDFTVSYTKELCKDFSVLIGNVYYGLQYPNAYGPNSNDEDEVYGGVSYNFPWFSAAFTTYGEVMHSADEYFELDLSKAIPLPMLDCWCKGTTLNLGTSFGYLILNQDINTLKVTPFGTPPPTGSFSGFDTCFLNASVTFPINKYLSVSPKVGLWLPLTSKASDYLQANSMDQRSTHFYGGINLTATF
ncbi:MAG: hypothetical protein P4L43_18050 [Syntrophobacteraceae bacterium]|nr:hypothetical protein [Syntrophobacteraceae bacterium]